MILLTKHLDLIKYTHKNIGEMYRYRSNMCGLKCLIIRDRGSWFEICLCGLVIKLMCQSGEELNYNITDPRIRMAATPAGTIDYWNKNF